jgi:glycosyltransferase involved in cell wall biosynthesis
MKIGVVTTSYPRSDADHAGGFVAAHAAELRRAGHEVDVIGAHTIASDLFYRGGAPDQLERGGPGTYLEAVRFSAELTRAVARHAHRWDLVIAHWLAPSALAALLGTAPRRALLGAIASSRLSALLASIGVALPGLTSSSARRAMPILAIAHGGDIHTLRRLGLLSPVLYALRARDVRLAFVSAELREVACAAAPRLASWLATAIVQPMGIDVARFSALRATAPSIAARKTVLVVGRLVPVKGVDVAINAVKLVASDANLVIAGDGPERARLESLAGADRHASLLAAPDVPTRRSIAFLGTVDTSTRDRLLAKAACVIIPSRVLPNGRSEGTPMIALEALAAGVPVIAAAVGGLRDLAGITRVRPDDPRALAVAIDRTLNARAEPHAVADTADLAKLDWPHVSARLLAHANGTGGEHAAPPQAATPRDVERRHRMR